MPGLRVLLIAFVILPASSRAATRIQPVPTPEEMQSHFFAVTVNGKSVDVAHAASNYDYVNFDTTGSAEISITAAEPGFWNRGVDIEPWRLGLRASRSKQTIRFRINGPVKLSLSRPGEFLNQAHMLFIFAGTPTSPPPPGPNVTIIPAGVHRQSLNPKSGETIYLEPGAFIFGSLNLSQVHNVKVLGRGTIVYDGPQDPTADEGWMQKSDWHCIGAYQSSNIEVDGLTCIVRSRTWSIQMKDSTGLVYDDLRVLGGNSGNANQDGMDWLGGGDAIVRNAFLRASDDDIAVLGNFDGYTDDAMRKPGSDANNITIENSQLSTSISNIVRIGWPQKVFNSRGFTLRNSDILHAGIGACGQTFALLGMWSTNGARGDHSDILFENLTVDNWYSLVQIDQAQPAVHDVTFRNIWAFDQPPLASSTLAGDVKNVTLENLKYGQSVVNSRQQVPLIVSGATDQPTFSPPAPVHASFSMTPALIAPNENVTFTAMPVPGVQYTWLFGDGSQAAGRRVRHRFADALGTDLDGVNGTGRFRVLLHVTDKAGHQDWAAQSIVIVSQLHDAEQSPEPTSAGLNWKIYAGTWNDLPDFNTLQPVLTGSSPNLQASAQGFTRWATVWEGLINIPADGGYTFHLIDRDGARLLIDGAEVAKTGPPFSQVCNSPGNALRYSRGAIGLRMGLHHIQIEALNTMSEGAPRLMWEGPGVKLDDVPVQAYVRNP